MAATAMDDLADRYADRGVTSVFLYTNEAHPGENYPHHTSMDVKRANARAFVEHSKVRRSVVLDDLEGGAHHAYGLLPNMTWIISRGLILYKAAWTVASDVEDAVDRALDFLARRRSDSLVNVYSERLAWRTQDPQGFMAGLQRNGPQAVADFFPKKK
jgi:hypothetical protein